MDLKVLSAEHREWQARNFPGSTAELLFMGVTEEVGELAHAILKMRQGIRGTAAEHTEEMKDAVGDIVIYLTGFCEKSGFSIDECVTSAWDRVSKRDWGTHPKNGVSE